MGVEQTIFINGKKLGDELKINEKGNVFVLDKSFLRAGNNNIAILATPILKVHSWDNINTDPGAIQVLTPPKGYKRKLFTGLAQVIVQSTGGNGEVSLKASSANLKSAKLKLKL